MNRLLITALVACAAAVGCGDGPKETKPTIAPGAMVAPGVADENGAGTRASPPAATEK
ncbi:MAG: hypothetical protein ACRC33_09320 [Gemmataceae bacterium]